MARRGRRPKPTADKRLAGNPGKRPLGPDDRKSEPADLKAPKGHLPRMGWLVWNRIAPHLSEMNILGVLDHPALEMMCIHYAYAYQAEKLLRKEGLLAEGSKGQMVTHPSHKILIAHSSAFLRYAREFGMTPSSLIGLIPVTGETEELSLAEQLFRMANNEKDE